MDNPPAASSTWRAFGFLTALSFIIACGDVDAYKVHTSSWEGTEALSDMQGRLVRLVRATTHCESEALLSLVGSHMEFPAEDVVALTSSCPGANEVNVGIDLDAKSIVYDFSNVAGSGVFASAEFNGYVIESMARSCGEISSATVDRKLSNLALDDDDVATNGHALRVNFAGLPFDETTFVKIDVVFTSTE